MQYRFGKYAVDCARFELRRNGRRVEVQPQVFRLLAYLIENRDRVVSRTELHDEVFGRRIVSENALTVRIRHARAAVGDSAATQAVIQTIVGVGYRFLPDVDAHPHGSVLPGGRGRAEQSSERMHCSSPLPLATTEPLLAVLPFEVIGADGGDDTIARGLVHDIITRVARSRTMLVIARGTAFQFASGSRDAGEIGRRLGVKYVVEGAVQTVDKKVRVSVALASTVTRQELWSWKYDRDLHDVFLVQDDIAETIVGALESEVQRLEMRASTLMPSSNLDAWSAYHRGLDHMYRFRSKDCDQAEKYFRRAIDFDPHVPRPYAGLSFVAYERAFLNIDDARDRNLRRSLDYASEALSIDPNDPMGHWALSRANLLKGNLEAANDAIARATELNPSYAAAQYFQGWVAMQMGDHQTCIDRIGIALRLSPVDPLLYGMLGVSSLALALSGQTEKAAIRVEKALAFPSIHYQAKAIAAVIYSLSGQLDDAREMMAQVRKAKPDYDLNEFFSVYCFREQDDIRLIERAFGHAASTASSAT